MRRTEHRGLEVGCITNRCNCQARRSRKSSQFGAFKCNSKARCRALLSQPPAVERWRSADRQTPQRL